MKKIICILLSLMLTGFYSSFAQESVKSKAKTMKQTATEAKVTTSKAQVQPVKQATKLKKDGTPDMRYKENKAAAKPARKLKKDGTPDMRYKENKSATKKK